MKKHVFAITSTLAFLMALPVNAQVDVVESAPIPGQNNSDSSPGKSTVPSIRSVPVGTSSNGDSASVMSPAQSGGGGQAELFYQMQVLQQEVLELRGVVEELSHELKRLKQQRLDDYLDLDRRVSALTGVTATPKAGSSLDSQSTSSSIPGVFSTGVRPENEKLLYRQAIDLVLKQKDYDKAVGEFNRYLTDYPNGYYAANAHYWLGEIYLLKNDLEQARQWFAKLLAGFPNHRKAADAKFKLGKVYYQLGDKVKAKVLLEETANSGTDAARLARNYLKENFN